MNNYVSLVKCVLASDLRLDRTGVGTRSSFGRTLHFNLEAGFPLLTLKNTHFKSIAYELLWFLRGESSAKWLEDQGVSIWREWGDPVTRDMGPIYGVQWRRWGTEEVDQIANVVEEIKRNPASRRLVVSAWNVADIPDMALPPCHMAFQFYVTSDGKLSCMVTQRSADLFLGVPFNIASYALLTHMVAHVCGLGVDELIMNFGDVHIYENHVEQCYEMLTRQQRATPKLNIRRTVSSIDDFRYEDFEIIGYDPHPAIRAPVAV